MQKNYGDKMMTPIQEASSLLNRDEVLAKRRRYWPIRRTQDIILSLLALLVLWPLMLVLALIIWIDSPKASPIFTQDRVGRDGKQFRFYKFRSMIPDAEEKLDVLLTENEMEGPAFKMKDDPRITRVGKFIRKTSLDELPQLWNILKGDMSIVGPRPPLPREVAEYGKLTHKSRDFLVGQLFTRWKIFHHISYGICGFIFHFFDNSGFDIIICHRSSGWFARSIFLLYKFFSFNKEVKVCLVEHIPIFRDNVFILLRYS